MLERGRPVRLLWTMVSVLAIFPGVASRSSAVTLVSRSAGLEVPLKEEGKTELETGDLNGDGHLDLVSVGDHGNPGFNSDEHGIMVWLGNGAGGWTVRQTGDFGYGGCAVGDLDRDGYLDLAWGVHHNYGTGMGSRLISAARGNGTGSGWTDWGTGLATGGESWGMFATALADFDADGRLDILSQSFGGSNGLRVYANHGDGTWSPAWTLAGGSVGYTAESCDFNADGHADIVCTRAGANALLGDGAFGFTTATGGLPAGTIHCVDAGDTDGDGRDDLVFGLGSLGMRCYRYVGSPGAWTDASSGLPVSGTYSMIQTGDINGDGHLDVVGYSAPTGRVFLGDGAGNWVADATWTMPSPGDFSALRVDGDLDHDGREDIFVQATQSGFPFYRNQLRALSPWSAPAELSAQVAAPRGGETFRVGSIRDLRWLAAVPESHGPAQVELRLSLEGDEGPWTTIASGLPNSGRYEWAVTAWPSSRCRIAVVVTAGGHEVIAMSPEDFTIALPEGTAAPDVSYARISDNGRLALHPNPARGHAVLRWTGHAPEQVSIISLDGRLRRTWPLASGDRAREGSIARAGSVQLSLRDGEGRALPRGVYLLRARRGAAEERIRIVIR